MEITIKEVKRGGYEVYADNVKIGIVEKICQYYCTGTMVADSFLSLTDASEHLMNQHLVRIS